MSDSKKRCETTGTLLVRHEVVCRRLKRPLPVGEHKNCSYCFGDVGDVETGEYARFCDYEEGKDPICFGFPET